MNKLIKVFKIAVTSLTMILLISFFFINKDIIFTIILSIIILNFILLIHENKKLSKFVNINEEIKKLEEEKTQLDLKISKQKYVNNTYNKNLKLQKDIEDLNLQMYNLNLEKNELKQKYINNSYNKNLKLQKDIDELNLQINNLKLEKSELEQNFSNISSENNNLLKKISSLESINESLNNEIELLNLKIESNKKDEYNKFVVNDKNHYQEFYNYFTEDYIDDNVDLNSLNNKDKIITEEKIISTYVAGTKYKNSDGTNRQNIIKNYVKDNHDSDSFDKDDYEYVSNKEIEEESGILDIEYYQYELTEYDSIKLEIEPDNPYDENAIKIIHNKMGHIGYIPSKDTEKVNQILSNKELDVSYKIILQGGRYKYFDTNSYKVRIKSKPFKFDLYITYK